MRKTHDSTIGEHHIKYYSFYIGDKSRPNNWVLFDVKIPGVDVRSAVCNWFHFVRTSYATKKGKFYSHSEIYVSPTREQVNYFVRKVVEYEREYTPKRGYTRHQYKRINIYNSTTILCFFRTESFRKSNNN